MDSIAEGVSACLRAFNSLCNAPNIWASAASDENLQLDDASLLRLKNELSRFKVWTGNIGAHRKGRSSLDHRLRDASNIRDQVIQLLQDLQESLGDAKDILMGETTPWDQDLPTPDTADGDDSDDASDFKIDPEAPSEISQIFAGIIEDINCLFRLSVSIHNPSPHDRFKKAALTDISHFEPFDVEHVRTKFATASTPVVERLGKAISRRRQYFKYRELHHQKLSSGLEDGMMDVVQSTVASSLPQKLSLDDPISLGLEDDESDTRRSQTSYATSAGNTERRKVPALPKEAEDGPFECPFCFMMISIQSRRLWKKHVFSDLCPYICVEQDCPAPDQDFQRRYQWSDHVRKYHWKIWACSLGCNSTFESLGEIKNHLAIVHAATSDSTHLNSLLSMCERPRSLNGMVECPLCKETLLSIKQYQRHVGRHQEDLALFALPELSGDEDECGDQTEEDEQVEQETEGASDEAEAEAESVDLASSISSRTRDDPVTEEIEIEWLRGHYPKSHIRHTMPRVDEPTTTVENDNNPHAASSAMPELLTRLKTLSLKKDVIYITIKGAKLPTYFPAFAIADGSVLVSHVQDRAALIMGLPTEQNRGIGLSYKGKWLKDPNLSIRNYGVKFMSQVRAYPGTPHEDNYAPGEDTTLKGSRESPNLENDKSRRRTLNSKQGKTHDASPAVSDHHDISIQKDPRLPSVGSSLPDPQYSMTSYLPAGEYPRGRGRESDEWTSAQSRGRRSYTDDEGDNDRDDKDWMDRMDRYGDPDTQRDIQDDRNPRDHELFRNKLEARANAENHLGASPPSKPANPQCPTNSDLPSHDSIPQSSTLRLAPDRWGNEIPPDALWTRVSRELIDDVVLERSGVRYEVKPDYVAILGFLSVEQVTEFARESAVYRGACFLCQQDRMRCGEERPCQRCIKLGCADTCRDGELLAD